MDASADFPFGLKPSRSSGAAIVPFGQGAWRLQVPPGAGGYRLAQLDDYHKLRRADFPHHAPLILSLRARAGAAVIPGTWGFGLWNDPFSMGVEPLAARLRAPSLPNAAWFFFASPPNYLSLRDDLPAQGATAGTFCSPRLPAPLLALTAPVLPLLVLPPAARLLRRAARSFVRQSAAAVVGNPTDWHAYRLDWQIERTRFYVDDVRVLDTPLSPQGPLGLVIWIDNQFMAFPPNGRMRYGMLESAASQWVEIADISLEGPLG